MMNRVLEGKRVALIGGAGFIGHNLALELARLGAEPHIIDGLQVNNLGAYSNSNANHNNKLYVQIINERLAALREADVPLHILDARDYHMLSRCLNDIQADTIIQLAAISHANRSNKDPFSTFDHSFRTLENALDVTRNSDTHFIYFSSSMVYGNFDGQTVTEDRSCNPIGIYGTLKYCGEKLVNSYNQVFGTTYTIIRPSALYGERCVSRRVGQAFIENALRGMPLTINGDGTDALDFTYIDDLIQGVVQSIVRKEAHNQIFNLTFGKARSLHELVGVVKKSFPDVDIKMHPRDHLMPERGTLSIDKARNLLGYEPKWPIELGFDKYISWYREFSARHDSYFQ